MLAGILDGLFDFHLALVDIRAQLLLDGGGDLVIGDGAVDLAVVAAAHGQLHNLALDFAGQLLSLGLLHFLAVLVRALGSIDGVERLGSGFAGQLAGQQEIAGIAVGDFQDLILLAGALDIFKQNNLHKLSPPFGRSIC